MILEPTGARYCVVEKMMEIKIIDLHTSIICHMLAYILAVTLSLTGSAQSNDTERNVTCISQHESWTFC